MVRAKLISFLAVVGLAACSPGVDPAAGGASAAVAAIEEMSASLRDVGDCGEAGFESTRNVDRTSSILAGIVYMSDELTLGELDELERAALEYVAVTTNAENICPDTDAVGFAKFSATMLLENITGLRA